MHKNMLFSYSKTQFRVLIRHKLDLGKWQGYWFEEGSGSNILFDNCFERVGLPQDIITPYAEDVYNLLNK